MSDQQAKETEVKYPDPEQLSAAMAEIAERSQRLVADFIAKQAEDPEISNPDPLNIGSAFVELTTHMMQNPAKLVEAQMQLWQQYYRLWHNATLRMMGEESEPVIAPQKGDRRFRDEAGKTTNCSISSNSHICCRRNGCKTLCKMSKALMRKPPRRWNSIPGSSPMRSRRPIS